MANNMVALRRCLASEPRLNTAETRVTCVIAGEHSQEQVGNPKIPVEPKRVQPGRNTDLKTRNQ
jgi:hypothetical protein